MGNRRFHLIAATLAMVVAQPALALPVPNQPLAFTVLRNGEPVGTNTITFQQTPAGLQVDVKTAIVVKITVIPVYRFEHEGHEVWQGDHLISLRSITNDDGTPHHLSVDAKGDGLDVKGDGYTGPAAMGAIPGSLWNPTVPLQSVLLNSLDGKLMKVATKDLGEETVTVRGAAAKAHHYSVDGDLKRDLWYNSDGTLVQIHLKAKDDSDILYVLR